MFEQKIILRDTRKAKLKKPKHNVQFSTTKRKSLLTAYIKKSLKNPAAIAMFYVIR